MIIDLDFHRRQKAAEDRYDLCPQVNIVFDVAEDKKDNQNEQLRLQDNKKFLE